MDNHQLFFCANCNQYHCANFLPSPNQNPPLPATFIQPPLRHNSPAASHLPPRVLSDNNNNSDHVLSASKPVHNENTASALVSPKTRDYNKQLLLNKLSQEKAKRISSGINNNSSMTNSMMILANSLPLNSVANSIKTNTTAASTPVVEQPRTAPTTTVPALKIVLNDTPAQRTVRNEYQVGPAAAPGLHTIPVRFHLKDPMHHQLSNRNLVDQTSSRSYSATKIILDCNRMGTNKITAVEDTQNISEDGKSNTRTASTHNPASNSQSAAKASCKSPTLRMVPVRNSLNKAASTEHIQLSRLSVHPEELPDRASRPSNSTNPQVAPQQSRLITSNVVNTFAAPRPDSMQIPTVGTLSSPLNAEMLNPARYRQHHLSNLPEPLKQQLPTTTSFAETPRPDSQTPTGNFINIQTTDSNSFAKDPIPAKKKVCVIADNRCMGFDVSSIVEAYEVRFDESGHKRHAITKL